MITTTSLASSTGRRNNSQKSPASFLPAKWSPGLAGSSAPRLPLGSSPALTLNLRVSGRSGLYSGQVPVLHFTYRSSKEQQRSWPVNTGIPDHEIATKELFLVSTHLFCCCGRLFVRDCCGVFFTIIRIESGRG